MKLNIEYPGFAGWYYNKVIPNITKTNQKDILLFLVNETIAGVSIIKAEDEERKICTLMVNSNFRKNGIGMILFNKSFEILGTEKPVLTISENRITEFSKLFSYYGFEMASVCNNYYKEGMSEYCFNGNLHGDFYKRESIILDKNKQFVNFI
ncbi:hypothetical protein [Acetivibrio cellulolyticus]